MMESGGETGKGANTVCGQCFTIYNESGEQFEFFNYMIIGPYAMLCSQRGQQQEGGRGSKAGGGRGGEDGRKSKAQV